jgi:diguanylate cyclase (GGDEF)-like protein
MNNKKKLSEQVVFLIIISSIAAVSMFIFGALRLFNSELLQGTIDFFIAGVSIACSVISYRQNSTRLSRWLLLALCSISLLLLAHFRGTDVLYWIYPIMMGAYYLLSPKQTFYFNNLLIVVSALIAFKSPQWIDAAAIGLSMMVANLFAFAFTRQNEKQQDKLEKLALYDSLTGVRNRRSFDDSLKEISQSQLSASMIVLDIDHFKKINDRYGHSVGDTVLKELGELIQNNIRMSDLLFRYGGEEFILLTRDNGSDMPYKLAEKLRALAESHDFSHQIKLSISAGVATLKPGESIEDWFRRADHLLYQAKEQGRNRVVAESTIDEDALAQA